MSFALLSVSNEWRTLTADNLTESQEDILYAVNAVRPLGSTFVSKISGCQIIRRAAVSIYLIVEGKTSLLLKSILYLKVRVLIVMLILLYPFRLIWDRFEHFARPKHFISNCSLRVNEFNASFFYSSNRWKISSKPMRQTSCKINFWQCGFCSVSSEHFN